MPKAWINGQYKEITDEELQNLSQSQGMQQPPTSPIAANMIGASTDAAKMAGTPAQRISARNTLQTAQRQEQATAPTQQSKQTNQQGTQLQQTYGDLQPRVQNLISKYLTPPSSAPVPQAGAQISQSALTGLNLSPEDSTAVSATIQKGLQNSASLTNADWQLLSQKAGITDLTHLSNFVDTGATTQNAVASQVSDQALAKDAKIADNDITALGLDPITATIQQVQQAVQNQIQDEFSQVNAAKQQALNPNLGPQERMAAMQQLKNLGASGVFATDQEMQGLKSTVDSADIINFNGQPMSVKDLLSDKNISDTVSHYLMDPDFAAELKKNNPDFASFIDSNSNALKDLTTKLDSAGSTVQEAINYNKAIGQTAGGNLSADVTKTLFPESSNFQSTKIDRDSVPVFKNFLNNEKVSGPAKQELVGFLNDHPDMAEEFKDLSPDEIKRLGMEDPNSSSWQSFRNFRAAYDTFHNTNPQDMPVNDILNKIFGTEGLSLNDVNTAISEHKLNKSDFDVDGNGTVTGQDIALMAKKDFGSGSLNDYLSGKAGAPMAGASLKSLVQEGLSSQQVKQDAAFAKKADSDKNTAVSQSKIKDILKGQSVTQYLKPLAAALDQYSKPATVVKTGFGNVTAPKTAPAELTPAALDSLKSLLKEEQSIGNTADAKSLKDLIAKAEPAITTIQKDAVAKSEADQRAKQRAADTKKDMIQNTLMAAPSPALKAAGLASKAAPAVKKLASKLGL